MTKKQREMRLRILVSGILFLLLFAVPVDGLARLTLYLVPYLFVGWDVLLRAAVNIKNGQVFDENFLMAVATIGAFGCGEYPEGVAVLLFYQVGELFQSVAVGKSRRSIATLMDIRPDSANVERGGQVLQVNPEEIAVGEIILIRPGERVPLDGSVLEGSSALDTAALTGESLPRDVEPGDSISSGCVNLTGVLRVNVERPYSQSTVARILDLVENASEKKSRAEHFITRFARYYTPVVVFAAVALAVLPPLVLGGSWITWVKRALNFLVVSCPCALVISIPLSFFGGIGGASRQGILVKGSNYLEALANAGVVVFDKTGTLTEGKFQVSKVVCHGLAEESLLELAALAESWSSHPISRAIREAWPQPPDPRRVSQVEELAGQGVKAVVDGSVAVLAGNMRLLETAGVFPPQPVDEAGTLVHVCVNGKYAGYLVVSDRVKPEAQRALEELKEIGISRRIMLTGDGERTAAAVANQLGLEEYYAGLLPGDKVDQVERLLKTKEGKETLVFVGDGINDAPVLTRADVGVAMGAMGSDAAIEAADIVLMDDDLQRLPAAIWLAQKTMSIVRQNIAFALGVKFLVLALSVFGFVGMWAAVFADVGVTVIAILNAGRTLKARWKPKAS